jgi:hypothetical protein
MAHCMNIQRVQVIARRKRIRRTLWSWRGGRRDSCGIDALHTFRHPAALIKIGMRRITDSAVSAQVLPRRCDLADHPLLQLALILRGELQPRVDT